MEALKSIEISIPLIYIILLILFSTLSLLSGKQKLAMLTNFMFVYYWGFKSTLAYTDIPIWFSSSYIIFGCMFLIFCLPAYFNRAWPKEIVGIIWLNFTHKTGEPINPWSKPTRVDVLIFSYVFIMWRRHRIKVYIYRMLR